MSTIDISKLGKTLKELKILKEFEPVKFSLELAKQNVIIKYRDIYLRLISDELIGDMYMYRVIKAPEPLTMYGEQVGDVVSCYLTYSERWFTMVTPESPDYGEVRHLIDVNVVDNLPIVINIDINGPVGTGKTYLTKLIKDLLSSKFKDINILTPDLDEDEKMIDYNKDVEFLNESLNKSHFIIKEHNLPYSQHVIIQNRH